jgi:hypothetical protein
MTLPMTGAGPSAVSAGGNGLLTALIAYWPGDEASGNLLDAHTNALHLTDVNTVTNNTGKVYATARQYTAANQEYHNRASEALLQIGDVDFTIASWVYCDALATGVLCIEVSLQRDQAIPHSMSIAWVSSISILPAVSDCGLLTPAATLATR